MNQDILGGKWQQLTGKVKEEWGKLTDDDLKMTEGTMESRPAGCVAPCSTYR